MNTKKVKGVIYARYSPGPNQTDQSIDGQVRDCMEYASQNDIDIIEIYADRHLTGTESEHRDEFQRMLRDSEKKQFSVLLVWKIDRFGRNRQEIALNKVHLKMNGVKVAYARESIPEGPEGIILESMLEGMAEYYSAELSQKIRRGQRESVLKGRIITVTPLFGYIKDAEMHYVIDENNAPVVVEIFEMYSRGYMLKQICDTLYDKGIMNPSGKRFTYNMIHNMLCNRQYLGEYRYGEYINETAIPPIISVELFDKVQDRIRETKKTSQSTAARAKATVPYLLSDKITCSKCGYHYHGVSGTGRHGERHNYYICHGKKNRKSVCDSKNFRKDWLEDFVFYHTIQDVLSDEMINYIADKVMSLQEADESSYSIRSLEKQYSNCNAKISNILRAIEAGIFNSTTQARLTELETQRDSLSISIAREKNKRVTFSKNQILYWMELFRDGGVEDEESRQKIFSIFINHIVIGADTVHIAYNLLNIERVVSYSDIVDAVRLRSVGVDLTYTQTNPHIIGTNIVVFVFSLAS